MQLIKRYLLLMLVVGISILPTKISAADITVQTAVNKAEITIGDPITFSIIINRKKHIVLNLPGLNVALGGFDIRDYKTADRYIPQKELLSTTILYTITTYATGSYSVPSLTVSYFDSTRNHTGTVVTDPMTITVKSIAASEAEDILDLKPPVTIAYSRFLLFLLMGIGILLIAGFGIYYFYMRKHWGGAGALFAPKEKPDTPAHTEAYTALNLLEEYALIDSESIRTYYFKVSEIVRRYQGRRYACQVLERTTSEIEADMMQQDVPQEQQRLFSLFYRNCDLVKFATMLPSKAAGVHLLHQAREIITQTTDTVVVKKSGINEEKNATLPRADAYEIDTDDSATSLTREHLIELDDDLDKEEST